MIKIRKEKIFKKGKKKGKTIRTSARTNETFRVTCVTFRFDIVNGTRSHELRTFFRGILCFPASTQQIESTNISYLWRKQRERKKSALLENEEWTKRLIIFSRFHFHRLQLLAECYEVTSAYEWPYSSACKFFCEASTRATLDRKSKQISKEKYRSIFHKCSIFLLHDRRDNINFYLLVYRSGNRELSVNNYPR